MSDLATMQYALTAALRDPQLPAPDGIAPQALQVYRRLVYNNIERALSRAFPVLRAISADDVWHARVQRFFAEHRCQNPELRHLAEDFIAWLDASAGERAGDPPWLAELCHYEWVELALASDAIELPRKTPQTLFSLERPPLLSPLAWTLSYRFPVHRLNAEYQPQTAPDAATYLIVYRDRADAVRFMEINALTLLLIRAIEAQAELSARELLQTLAAELENTDPQAIVEAGSTLLYGLVERDIILGSRSA
ncbi:DNA-binding domain-containing protein [Hydrocarboniphaga sp.]|uniref:HvfC family RiPP maturation protein n=1 Tax=Hydrocarboniphaga sp. TaxID=2033016 RepID=UPI003D0A1361